ncbi:MAG: endonuclease MutS2 [Balneolaceae bacterium]
MRQSNVQFTPPSVLEKIGFDVIRETIGNHLYTPEGKRLLNEMKPSADEETVRRLQQESAEMLGFHREDRSLPFTPLESIHEWLDQSGAEGSVLNLQAFQKIRKHARLARVLKTTFEQEIESSPALYDISAGLQPLKKLEDAIRKVVTDEGNMRHDASSGLKSIRSKLNNRKQALRNTIERIFKKVSSGGMASDEGPTIRSGRMVIPVQAEYKRKVDGFIHDVSASGQTVYLEPVEALQINNDIRQLEISEKQEIERILRNLTDQVREHRSILQDNAGILGKLDLIAAKTRASLKWEGTIPRLSKDGSIHIIRGFNPKLLLKNLQLKPENREQVVPLDLDIAGEERGIIISGPNAGGKSVALKTVGILSCMFQCGIPLPVEQDSRLPVLSGIYLDMGDEQSIENDLSTFSSRLQWMHQTLENLDQNGLVLIDEAGTGTDPEEGGALFQAFMEAVLERPAKFIATTHHGALKVFAHDHPQIVNGAMEFDQKTLAPTYRFRKGIPGSSYAFEIAGRMNLSASILERSRQLLGEQRDRLADLLLSLERKLKESEETRSKYDKLQQQAEKRVEAYQKKSDELERQRAASLEKAYREADEIMKQANQKIEQAVEKISNLDQQDSGRIRQIRSEVTEHKKKIRENLSEKSRRTIQPDHRKDPPEVGDQVRLADGETTGELIERNEKQAVVLAGGLKIKTQYKNLVKTSSDKKKSKTKKWKAGSWTSSLTQKKVGPSLNIRGCRGDEAVKKVLHYLDNAIAAGFHEVDIIHGKGEGILKKLVHEYLEQRSEVAEFDLAPLERGGAGCTVVKFKA